MKDMLNYARELQYDQPGVWTGGQAEALISFHSKELRAVRNYAPTRKILILRTYTYLREAKEKRFHDNSMIKALYKTVMIQGMGIAASAAMDLATPSAITKNEGGDKEKEVVPKKPECSHCKNLPLHYLFKAQPYKRVCPLRSHGATVAKSMAGVILKKYQEDPSADLQGIKDQVVSDWKY